MSVSDKQLTSCANEDAYEPISTSSASKLPVSIRSIYDRIRDLRAISNMLVKTSNDLSVSMKTGLNSSIHSQSASTNTTLNDSIDSLSRSSSTDSCGMDDMGWADGSDNFEYVHTPQLTLNVHDDFRTPIYQPDGDTNNNNAINTPTNAQQHHSKSTSKNKNDKLSKKKSPSHQRHGSFSSSRQTSDKKNSRGQGQGSTKQVYSTDTNTSSEDDTWDDFESVDFAAKSLSTPHNKKMDRKGKKYQDKRRNKTGMIATDTTSTSTTEDDENEFDDLDFDDVPFEIPTRIDDELADANALDGFDDDDNETFDNLEDGNFGSDNAETTIKKPTPLLDTDDKKVNLSRIETSTTLPSSTSQSPFSGTPTLLPVKPTCHSPSSLSEKRMQLELLGFWVNNMKTAPDATLDKFIDIIDDIMKIIYSPPTASKRQKSRKRRGALYTPRSHGNSFTDDEAVDGGYNHDGKYATSMDVIDQSTNDRYYYREHAASADVSDHSEDDSDNRLNRRNARNGSADSNTKYYGDSTYESSLDNFSDFHKDEDDFESSDDDQKPPNLETITGDICRSKIPDGVEFIHGVWKSVTGETDDTIDALDDIEDFDDLKMAASQSSCGSSELPKVEEHADGKRESDDDDDDIAPIPSSIISTTTTTTNPRPIQTLQSLDSLKSLPPLKTVPNPYPTIVHTEVKNYLNLDGGDILDEENDGFTENIQRSALNLITPDGTTASVTLATTKKNIKKNDEKKNDIKENDKDKTKKNEDKTGKNIKTDKNKKDGKAGKNNNLDSNTKTKKSAIDIDDLNDLDDEFADLDNIEDLDDESEKKDQNEKNKSDTLATTTFVTKSNAETDVVDDIDDLDDLDDLDDINDFKSVSHLGIDNNTNDTTDDIDDLDNLEDTYAAKPKNIVPPIAPASGMITISSADAHLFAANPKLLSGQATHDDEEDIFDGLSDLDDDEDKDDTDKSIENNNVSKDTHDNIKNAQAVKTIPTPNIITPALLTSNSSPALDPASILNLDLQSPQQRLKKGKYSTLTPSDANFASARRTSQITYPSELDSVLDSNLDSIDSSESSLSNTIRSLSGQQMTANAASTSATAVINNSTVKTSHLQRSGSTTIWPSNILSTPTGSSTSSGIHSFHGSSTPATPDSAPRNIVPGAAGQLSLDDFDDFDTQDDDKDHRAIDFKSNPLASNAAALAAVEGEKKELYEFALPLSLLRVFNANQSYHNEDYGFASMDESHSTVLGANVYSNKVAGQQIQNSKCWTHSNNPLQASAGLASIERMLNSDISLSWALHIADVYESLK